MAALVSQSLRMGNYSTEETYLPAVKKARSYDLDTFNQLVLEHQDAVYRQAYWILGDEAAAEDAVQEAFLRAYRNMSAYNGGPFLPWILRITTNYCLDQLRRQKVRRTTPLEALVENNEENENNPWLQDRSPSIEETLVRAEEQTRVMNCIRRLPPEYRAAIVLVDLQELAYSQAAASMGVCLGTFKSRLARARVQLQKDLRGME